MMSCLEFNNKDRIGEGGNAYVHLMKSSTGEEIAVKVLKSEFIKANKDTTKLKRFITEIQIVKDLCEKGQKGIIPIIDSKLPCEDTNSYYYVMPYAIPLKDKEIDCSLIYDRIAIYKDLATTLSELHKANITHRDIKRENILFYNDKYCFGDFGLVDFPDKEQLTKNDEIIGNRSTLAPEMRTPNKVSDFRPADVYSFAKTLWMTLTAEEYAFDGQYNYFENDKLQRMYPEQHFVELYELLADATAENPAKRPTIDEFLERLINWERISQSQAQSDRSLWRFIEANVVKQNNPSTVIWRNKQHVIGIIKQLSKLNFNHTFIHGGGGMDLLEIDEFLDSKESGMVKINLGFDYEVFNINRLIWENPNGDPEFSYFRLELEEIDPIFPEVVKEMDSYVESLHFGDETADYDDKTVYEDLLVDSNGEYSFYNGDEDGRLYIRRWFKGTFLIVPKGSMYNYINETYDGRHSKLNADEFREYMELLQYFYRHKTWNGYFMQIAAVNPFIDDNFNELKKIRLMTNEEVKNYIQDSVKN